VAYEAYRPAPRPAQRLPTPKCCTRCMFATHTTAALNGYQRDVWKLVRGDAIPWLSDLQRWKSSRPGGMIARFDAVEQLCAGSIAVRQRFDHDEPNRIGSQWRNCRGTAPRPSSSITSKPWPLFLARIGGCLERGGQKGKTRRPWSAYASVAAETVDASNSGLQQVIVQPP
jgi:hypothetical protein